MLKFLTNAALISGVAGMIASFPAAAATSTDSMGVSATVAAVCTEATAPLAFGNYSGNQVDQISAVTVNCTNGTPYAVSLSSGAIAGQRAMVGPNNQTLAYSIYSDAAHTTVWGAGSGGSVVSNVGSGGPQTLPVYGSIPHAQSPSPGAYQDTVVVTLTY